MKNQREQIKANAPKKAPKIELGINYNKDDLTQFFKKLYPIKNQALKEEKTADSKESFSQPCSIVGCKKQASDEPKYEGISYNCQVKRIVGNLNNLANDKQDLE